MFRGDDDDNILDDPYWTQPSSPSNSSDSDAFHPDVAVYFPYSSAPPSPSTLKSENDEWKIEYQRAIKKLRTDYPELQYDYYIDNHGICRPHGYIPASMLPSTRGQHSYDCRCHTCYDWNKTPSVSSNTGCSDRSTASHQAYEAEWDNWTANHLPPGTPDSHTSTIATHATWYSDDHDGAANVVRVNVAHQRQDLCILDSGANRIVFNNDSWLENTNSIPLTPTNTKIYGISGTVHASMQTIVGNSPILICPDMTDNVLSQGWLAKN
jgi:hypothetical protein